MRRVFMSMAVGLTLVFVAACGERVDGETECDDARPCPSSLECVEGECVEPSDQPECDDARPCSSGLECVEGECVEPSDQSECDDARPCAAGLECVEGECVEPPEEPECDDTRPCAGGLECVEGACVEPGDSPECDDERPCPFGQSCVDGECVEGEVCPDGCLIGNACVPEGHVDVDLRCAVCDPERDRFALSIAPAGTSCVPHSALPCGVAVSACDGLGSECPEIASYEGDTSWPLDLEITEDATYCWTFNGGRPLEAALTHKAKLYLFPGRYPAPADDVTAPFRLPFCLVMASVEGASMTLAHDGSGTIARDAASGQWRYHQPMMAEEPWELDMWFWGNELPVLNGGHPRIGESTHRFSLRKDDLDLGSRRDFHSCSFEGYPRWLHTVEFDGGHVTLEVRIALSMAGTEPGIFYQAHGSLDGEAFEIQDYWRLVYSPGHHHFIRNFAVVLGEESSGPCALRVEGVVPWDEPQGHELVEVSTASCSLHVIESREVLAITTERVDP